MNYDTPLLLCARIILGLTLFLTAFYLPGIWLWGVALVGGVIFPWYMEGIVLFFLYQIITATAGPWWHPWAWLGTVLLIIAMKFGTMIHSRLFFQP